MTNSSIPFFTIIIAVFNAEKTIQKCINSFALQSYKYKQLIIIDGNSTDNTKMLLQKNSENIDFWISEPDTGIYNAWNKGLLHSKGNWICFLGADDYFYNENVLSKYSLFLQSLTYPVKVVYGKIMLINSEDCEMYTSGKPWLKVKQRFKQYMSIPHPGTMHHQSLFDKHGFFDESFKIAGDYEFLLRELKFSNAEFIPDLITVAMQQGGISSNPKHTIFQLFEVRRAQRKNGISFAGIFWFLALVRVNIRFLLWKLIGEKNTRHLLDFARSLLGLPAYWTKT